MNITRLSEQAAKTFARHMILEPRFEEAQSAAFFYYGLKIVVTKEPDNIDRSMERHQAFENADKTYEETP